MDLNLKSVLKDRRSSLGARAALLALSLVIFPSWASVAFGVILFISTYGPSFNLIYSFLSFLYIASIFSGFASPLIVLAFGLIGFYLFLILSIKEIIVRNRTIVLAFLSSFLIFVLNLGFFSGAVNIIVFVLINMLIVRDLLVDSIVFPKKILTLSAVIALLSAEITWSIFYFGFNHYLSSLITLLTTSALVNIIFQHLKGSLIKRRAIFYSSAIIISVLMIALVAAFRG